MRRPPIPINRAYRAFSNSGGGVKPLMRFFVRLVYAG